MAHLTESQVAHFEEQGYLVVEDLFDPEQDIDPVIEEYATVLDRLALELKEKGEISSTYDDLPFGDRLTKIYAESGKVHAQYFDFSLPQRNVRRIRRCGWVPRFSGCCETRNSSMLSSR